MESNFDIHKWQAKYLKESEEQHGGYVEVLGPDFDDAVELIQSAWEDWKNGPATEPEDIAQAKEDIINYITSLLN